MNVVKKGKLPTIECPVCNSVLEYSKDDISPQFVRGGKVSKTWHWITCPVCKTNIRLEDKYYY